MSRRRFRTPRPAVAIAAAMVAVTVASTAVGLQAASAASAVTAELTTHSASSWWAGGQFVVRNASASASSWALTFAVPSGTFQNNAGWNTTTTVDGERVTIRPKAPTPAGQSIDISFGIAGTGTSDLGVAQCAIDGSAVAGCSSDDAPGDSTPPTVPSSVGAAPAGDDRVRVSWTASTDNTKVDAYEVRSHGGATTDVGGATTDLVIAGHEPGKTYRYDVRARDVAGNTSDWSAAATVTMPAAEDTTAPSAPADVRASDVTDSAAMLRWTASTDDRGVDHYEIATRAATSPDVRIDTTRTTTAGLTGLEADTRYISTVTAVDAAGNRSPATPVTFTTSQPAPIEDTQPPSRPANLTVTVDASTVTATARWNASTDNTGVNHYELVLTRAGDGSVRRFQTEAATADLRSLVTGSSYTLAVTAVDAAGNVSPATSKTFSTADRTAPSIPTQLTATASTAGTIDARWAAATDNVGVTGYDVRVDQDRIVHVSNGTAAMIDGLSAATTYRIDVRARDTAGNTSAWSTPVSATTLADAPAPGTHLVVEDTRSVAPLAPLGAADDMWRTEGRWFSASDFQPTGRYVTAGTPLRIDVPTGITTARASIGMYTSSTDTPHREIALRAGTNTVTAPVDGMVFMINRATSGPAGAVTVTGGQPVPTFVSNVTTTAEFRSQLTRWADTPYVSVVGDRIFGDFQRAIGADPLRTRDPQNLVDIWDANVNLAGDIYGLSRTGAGVDRMAAHRLYISHVDSGDGYASAWDDRITFSNRYHSARELLNQTPYAQYALAHEIGHVYQLEDVRWGEHIERANDISALYVMEQLNGRSYIDTPEVRTSLANFRKTPVAERDFNNLDDHRLTQSLMFDQLRRGFGDSFYAHLAHTIRQAHADGATSPYTGSERFYWLAATTADRDLRPFFAEWGIPITGSLAADMAALPPLRTEIWNNTDRATDQLERELPPLR